MTASPIRHIVSALAVAGTLAVHGGPADAAQPPCSVANPCSLMRDDIAQSCGMSEASSPLPPEPCAAGRAR